MNICLSNRATYSLRGGYEIFMGVLFFYNFSTHILEFINLNCKNENVKYEMFILIMMMSIS